MKPLIVLMRSLMAAQLLLLLLPSVVAFGQVAPPITSSGLNTQVSAPVTLPSGQTQYNITGGTRPGGGANLFHSFGNFNVPNNNIANFLNDSGLATSNILGRVTGGNISNIFGTIQTTGFGSANLFLMNPAGFLFGPNATVNVGGMVAFTSADYLRLADGVRFNATPNATADALLTPSPVAAFGFLGSNPGAITVQGSQFTVTEGTGISLVGGNVSIQSGTPENGTVQPARLSAPNGKIQLASAASPGEFDAATLQPLPNVNGSSFTSFGSVTLAPGSTINVSGANTVSIRGGQFVISVDNAVLTTAATPAQADSVILNNGSVIAAETSGATSSGDITLNANTVQLNDGSLIATTSQGGGAAGNINLTVSQSLTLQGVDSSGNPSRLLSDSNSSGNSGAINIQAPSGSVLLDGGLIRTSTNSDGLAGDINLNVRNLTARAGGQILTSGSDAAPSGSITVNASDLIWLTGRPNPSDPSSSSGIFNVNNGFNGTGSISITTNNLLMEQGARIRNDAFFDLGGTEAPKISIAASNNVTLSGGSGIIVDTNFGDVGSLAITAHSISLSDVSVISTRTIGPGAGGPITLTADTISISGGSQVVSSTEQDAGRGGDVTIVATDRLSLSGQGVDQNGSTISSGIFTFSSPFATGDAGTVSVYAGTVEISGGAQINSSTFGSGAAGNITLQGTASPAQSILIDGSGSGIFTTTSGTGAGGNININANSVTLQNGGTLSAATAGTAPSATGGTITVQADQIVLQSGATINSSTSGSPGDGGTVTLYATDSIALSNSTIYSNSQSSLGTPSLGNGGQLNLTAPLITLTQGSALLATTNGPGHAGTIELNTNTLSLTDMSVIQTSTQGPGPAGSITVQGLGGSGTKAQTVSLAGGSALSSTSNGNDEGEGGAAGNILVETQTLSLSGGSQITTSSLFSPGDAGTITINAGKEVILSQGILTSRSESNIPDEFVTDYAIGNAGSVIVSAPTVTLMNHSKISSTTDSRYPGDPSKGNAGSVTIRTANLNLSEGSQLTSSSIIGDSGQSPVGNAGSVTIEGQAGAGTKANTVTIDGINSGILTETQGTGAGGNINIAANSVTLQNGGMLSATTSGSVPEATGGTITVHANQVRLNNGALITAASTGAGAGGSITIGADSTFASNAGTVSSTATQATGGDITITAGQSVTLDNGSLITASSSGPGDAGNILINAGHNYTSTNSAVTTRATAPDTDASGGNITVLATDMVQLTNSQLDASVQGSLTTVGGNITIDPQYVILTNSQILARASQGQGGVISINITNGGLYLPDAISTVSASSQFGVNGTVTIQSPNSPASGKINPLSQKPLIVTSLLSQRCAALASGELSSLTVAGRDSLPAEPGSWLSTPLALSSEFGDGTLTQGGTHTSLNDPQEERPLLSLRQIAPPGFLTRAFAQSEANGCDS
ncbi:beta strand repeat-containing protein [Nitrospira sp. NS4]|uniref:beta strand repeat-containing protein n=1 Tax=Nitrospira sp. NS4 TaxID=3414498 RepID=UPI003C2F7B1A